ncbi:hypothetical protein O3G_MSEX008249 [Manduca sexta]|uniref:ZAD domain-containing protein n=1 Tax=Manduca sexta TaxID=7130 RepID=A0A921Z992_MANSE|nr:hypothetical protein O3G_MSEX008249 [Manduca sexta]
MIFRICWTVFLGNDPKILFKMSVVKVNPKLFGTCRLCLEDLGQYLIVPKVQEQIKYCFDINVEPFDGLPQLLCNACEDTLNKFFETKKKIVNKQNDLINKIELKNTETQHSQETDLPRLTDSTSEPSKPTVAKCKQIVLSFSCSRLDQPSQCTPAQNKNHTKKSVSWLSHYKKSFACRLCNYCSLKKHNMLKHTRNCHKTLRAKHEHILKNNCKIKLDKLDKIPNITGLNDIVVISTEKIVQDIDKSYFIIYTPKVVNRLVEKHNKSDISDDECKVKKKRKISNDSLESKIEDQQDSVTTKDLEKDSINGDCIKIDDSSDNASEKNCNSGQEKSNFNDAVTLQKTIQTCTAEDHKFKIQNIISMCHNKYKKNIDLHKMHRTQQNNPEISKSQLKHKVLSIGRKIINKQGFNCTGLLRYMEHRNLEIVWTPNTSNFNSDTNYVRIMTKLRGNVVDEDDLGWKMIPVNQVLPTISRESAMPKISQVFYSDKGANWKVDTKSKLLNKNPVANPKQLPRKTLANEKHNESVPPNLNQTCLNDTQHTISNSIESSGNESSMPDISARSVATQETFVNQQNKSVENKKNDVLPSQNNTDNDTELTTGRIKVKPLAELLSKEGLMNRFIVENPTVSNSASDNKQSKMITCLVQTNDIQARHLVPPPSYLTALNHINLASASHMNLIRPIIQPSQVLQTIDNTQISYPVPAIIQPIQPSQATSTNEINQNVPSNQKIQLNPMPQVSAMERNNMSTGKATYFAPSTRTEFVIMDTVELPSVKTNSPIQYLEKLLQSHNICLLDQTNKDSSHYFVCLIRFKVLYKQDTTEDPILLSLSLFCHKNKFCIKVKNMNQENIDISNISASWQWEIIKVFKGEVANKMLQNAQNVNQETYEYANRFVTLLKSINYIKV